MRGSNSYTSLSCHGPVWSHPVKVFLGMSICVADGLSGGHGLSSRPFTFRQACCCVSKSKTVLPSVPRDILSVVGRRGLPVSVICHPCCRNARFMTVGQGATPCFLRVGSYSLPGGFCRSFSFSWCFCCFGEFSSLVFKHSCTSKEILMTAGER